MTSPLKWRTNAAENEVWEAIEATTFCPDCTGPVKLQAIQNGNGLWYVGYACPACGPMARFTDYTKSETVARIFLKDHAKDLPIPIGSRR